MTSQPEAYARFRALHERPSIFVMPNVWDGASAVLLKRAGFEALATSSAAIAFGLGRQDCAHAVSRAEAVGNGTLIGSLTGLPVNDDCVATVEAAIAGGLAGLGIEDSTADPARPIHDFDDAVARIRAAAQAAKGRILLTGRTDNYLHKRPDLDDTIRRLVAFAEAGADVLFAPGLPDMDAIRAVVRAVAPRPVNVVVGPASGPVPLATLAEAGVRRVSIGASLYNHAMTAVAEAAVALAGGDIASAVAGMKSREISGLLPG
jgi:2-methylisocitrate lyase-like PEP mutase family enzyme